MASQDKKEDQDVMPQELTVRVRDGFRVSEGIGVKTIDPTRTGKSKIRSESYRGFQQSKSDQSRVFVQWLRDKDKDLSAKTVTDQKTGEVLHHLRHRLSEHRGHGSAKLKLRSEAAMRERLEKIRNGDTLFMPDIEGLDIKAFQAVVKQLDDLHAKGYIGSLKKEHSKRIGQYMDVIYVTVENGITESGMHYLDSRKGFSAS